jgi:putative glutamine amidotransferase
VTIGITDCEKYSSYEKWITVEPDVEVIRLGSQFSNLEEIKKCDGILLTGGDDVHPRFYGSNETHYPNAPDEFVEERDEFEIKVFAKAQENKLPVLGVCRGLQLINCALGGTLNQDLGELNKIHRRITEVDKVHQVKVNGNTQLKAITKIEKGEVNSSHHQSIDKLGKELIINSIAMDGTIEGIERISGPFLLAVQWHPERMLDKNNPLSKNIKKAFLESATKFQVKPSDR